MSTLPLPIEQPPGVVAEVNRLLDSYLVTPSVTPNRQKRTGQ